jgi:outer membrane usher protein
MWKSSCPRHNHRLTISPPGRWAGILVLLLVLTAGCFAQEQILVKVVMNTVDEGECFMRLTEDGDVLFPADALRQLGISDVGKLAADAQGAVSLRSLSPDIDFTVEEGSAAILLTVNPSLLPIRKMDFAVKPRSDVLYPEESSLFLNYSLDFMSAGTVFDMPVELCSRIGRVLFLSGARFAAAASASIIRNLTSAIIDDRSTRIRISLGDFVAGSGGLSLGSAGIFGGVSVTKNFSLDPFYVKEPDIVVRDLLSTPSTVKVLLNDMRSGSEMKSSPGALELAHLPLLPGANSVALVVTDADGHVRKIEIPYYRSTQLLAPGVEEYSYSAGFRRLDVGSESFSYGTPAFLGFHKAGIFNWLTGGLRAEGDGNLLNGGPTAAFTLGLLGEINSTFALSCSDGITGYAGEVDYSYLSTRFGVRVSGKYLSSSYSTLSLTPDADKPQWEGSVSLAFNTALTGSFSAGASYTRMWGGSERETLTLSYARPLGENLQLTAILAGIVEEGTLQYQGSVGVRILIGEALCGLSYGSDGTSGGVSADIQKSVSRGTGVGYSGSVQEARDGAQQMTFDGSASLTYNGRYGTCSAAATYRHDESSIGMELNAKGSLVLIDNSLQLSRSITDSFALVKVEGVPGLRVKYSNQYVGVTDRAGRAIVPGLTSYNENEVSIERADIPMSFTSGVTRVFVSPPYRGGGVVSFTVTRLQALTGKLFIVKDGARTPAAFAGLEVTVGPEVISSVVGIDGAFYLENIPAGTYRARLLMEDRVVAFNLVVPQGEESLVDLGEIDCPAPVGK